jgi:hypothetical protein
MGDRRGRAFRRWRTKAKAAAAPAEPEAPVPEPVSTGPLLAVPLPQRRRVAGRQAAVATEAPADGGTVQDITAMMDYLRREN